MSACRHHRRPPRIRAGQGVDESVIYEVDPDNESAGTVDEEERMSGHVFAVLQFHEQFSPMSNV